MDFLQHLPSIYPLPFYIKNHEGRFILTNDAFARLYNMDVDNLLSKGSLSFDFSFDRDLEILKTNNSVVFEECFRLENGKKIWFSTVKRAFQQADGKRYLISVSSDVSQYKLTSQTQDQNSNCTPNTQEGYSINTTVHNILEITRKISKDVLDNEDQLRLEQINRFASALLKTEEIPEPQNSNKEDTPESKSGKNTQLTRSGKKITVLLAEDNENNLELTFSQLTAKGILVDIATNGEDALNKAKRKAYDLILMDIQMPVTDGISATKQIRQLENPNSKTSIIAFTANLSNLSVEEYKQNGFTDFLSKPYTETELINVVSKYLFTESTESTNKLYDFSGLGDLSKDAVFIQKMQKLFIQTVPEQLEELSIAFNNEDWTVVASIAHKLKSTYGNIKVIEPAAAMKKIETYALEVKNITEIPNLIKQAHAITMQVVDLFHKELNKLD